MEDFADLLKECMGTRSQQEFADEIGSTQCTVSRVLARKQRPNVRMLQGVIAAYPERRDDAVRLFLAEINTNRNKFMRTRMEATS